MDRILSFTILADAFVACQDGGDFRPFPVLIRSICIMEFGYRIEWYKISGNRRGPVSPLSISSRPPPHLYRSEDRTVDALSAALRRTHVTRPGLFNRCRSIINSSDLNPNGKPAGQNGAKLPIGIIVASEV